MFAETTTFQSSTTFIDLAYKTTGAEISLSPEALKQKENALAALEQITEVSTPQQLAVASNMVAIAMGLEKKIEATRKEVKRPVLDLGELIDTTAKNYIGTITVAKERVLALVNSFNKKEAARVAEENRVREAAEAVRLAELETIRRKEEAEAAERERVRLAEIAENNRIAAEAAEAARIAALPKEPGEDPALLALRAAAAQEEQAEIERERLASEQKIKDEQEAQRMMEEAERLKAEAARTTVTTALVVAPPKVKGMSTQKPWKYTVQDPVVFFKAHPELCKVELIPSAINQAIKDGLRESPGITIYQDDVTRIKAAL